ncbi:hypothetical protein SRHO_G00229570 [Serrasalmus rhombeus]
MGRCNPTHKHKLAAIRLQEADRAQERRIRRLTSCFLWAHASKRSHGEVTSSWGSVSFALSHSPEDGSPQRQSNQGDHLLDQQ